MPFAPWPFFAEDEIRAAAEVLHSGKVNYWTGEQGRRFEQEFAKFAGCKYAVALANGTVALEAALRSLGVGPNDEVITTARTFIASASCAVAIGAHPVIADVDRDSQNLTAETILAAVTPRTKAIVAVHLAGWPCEMDDILILAREHGLKVIEDCAQAHGAAYKGRPVGSMGDAACFSFCQDKIMTTAGEGGMLTTNSEEVWRRAWSYKDHGKDYGAAYAADRPAGFRWLHGSFGTNWRRTEMQAAIGRVVLPKVAYWVETRRRNAAILNRAFEAIPALRVTVPPAHIHHSYYKHYVFVRPEKLGQAWGRDRIMQEINAAGVPCTVGSCGEIYREAAFAGHWAREKSLPFARELAETSLMFMVHPTLSEDSIRTTAAVVSDVVEQASKPVWFAASASSS